MRAKITLNVTEIFFFMHCFCVDVHIKLCTKAGNEPSGRLKFHNHGEGPLLGFTGWLLLLRNYEDTIMLLMQVRRDGWL